MAQKKAVLVKINTRTINKMLKTFSPGGDLQKFIDMEVVRLSDPFAPSDTKALRASAFARTDFGSGQVIYEIYGNPNGRNTWNDDRESVHWQDAPMRGPRWVERAMGVSWPKLMGAVDRFMAQRG